MNNKINERKYYLLAEIPDQRFNAGEKARVDVVNIAIKNNYEHIVFFHKGRNKVIVFLEMIISMIKLLLVLKKDDIVAIQYPYTPVGAYKLIYRFFHNITKVKKAKNILIIHDINYFRNITENKEELDIKYNGFTREIEVNIISKFNYIICHNSSMKEKLINDGVDGRKIIELKIFDYLFNGKNIIRDFNNMNIEIAIAGNLDSKKAGYVGKLKNVCNDNNISFQLYGPGYDDRSKNQKENIKYNGMMPPDDLPKKIKGNFGLVWDGDSLNECNGVAGRYLKYNNPHKASLYIASGLPLIVWKHSAISKFVEENNIGICINSLYDLPNVMKKIDIDQYKNILNNVNNMKVDLNRGRYLSEALKKASDMIN